jgi:hypothetical protein
MNETLDEIHHTLIAQVDNLSNAIDNTADINVRKQLLTEMDEITHRINIIQNLLFTRDSAKLDAYSESIKTADDALSQSIKGIQGAADVLAKTTELLKYVDEAIDLAKTLAI